ncbi:hypothetical protein IC607_02370 [Cellulomonas sp. JH27-2]|uniref:hypothetical protein n=1 Tax=Cellulomonas sp. JH27-2 TaxID=2774139 RepID=UPI00178721CB|nr:hypothetical protein [Cellulomonas sp. JH27-2]MBD8057811.1 hypothetical protein [Cellulomonas sp. JH27-2]
MPEPTSDEDWAAGLQALAREVPAVPVDVAGAVRRGRRRRAARSVALGAGSLAVVVGVVAVAGPSLLGGLGPVSDSGDSAASMADGAAMDGASSGQVWSVEALAADVAAAATAPPPAQDQPLSEADSAAPARLTVEQHGEPDLGPYRAAIDAATGSVPASAFESSAQASPGVWPEATVACLQGAGWEVVVTDDGWSAQVPTSSPVQFLADVDTCTPAA